MRASNQRTKIRDRVESIIQRGVHDLGAIIHEAINETSWSSGRIATQAKAVALEMGIILTGGKNVYFMKPRGEHVNNLVKQGCTLQEIGKAMGGRTRELARQYIGARGFYDVWAEAKQKRKLIVDREKCLLQEMRGGLVSSLRERVYQLAQSDGWAAEKAVEYLFAVGTTLHLDNIKRVFERYQDALRTDSKASLEELGMDSDLSHTTVSNILRKTGLKHFNANYKRLTRAELMAIKRSERLPLSDQAVAYFLGINGITVRNHRHYRLDYFNYIRLNGLGFGRGRGCNFATTSQIYGAQDAGFTNEEISRLLDLKQITVDSAIKQRESAEPEIVRTLRKLYGRMDVSQPYKNLGFLQ